MNNDDVETIENCPKSLAAWRREVENLRTQLEAERQRADDAEKERDRIDRRNAELNSTLERWSVERAENANEIEDLKAKLANPVVLPDIRSEDYHETGWFQHIRYYRAVVRSIQALGFAVKGE